MGGDITVVRDEKTAYDDGTVACVHILSVSSSDQYSQGVKYAFHYGKAGAEHPIIHFNNYHGPHELHIRRDTYEIEYPGLEALYEAWRAALPLAKRADW